VNFLNTFLQLSLVYASMARANYSSCFFTSTPIAAALCKPIFRLIFLGIAAVRTFIPPVINTSSVPD
jgi:hypothetical protein